MVEDTGTKVFYIRADEELHRQLKASAAMNGLSLQSLCETILRAYVQQQSTSGATVTWTGVIAPSHQPTQGASTTKTTAAAAT